MPRFTNMLVTELTKRGHHVQLWRPKPHFVKIQLPSSFKKWLGYIDQYLVFPFVVRKRLRKCEPETLFVFSDHALGPWVSLVASKPHVIHCHDFLAQFSALGKIPENPTGWTGRQYQSFIRRGYQKGKNFISVSQKTQADLLCFLRSQPIISEVVYNGLNRNFNRTDNAVKEQLSKKLSIYLKNGFILHVGGNQWYKNRIGVIQIYEAWRARFNEAIPLLLVGAKPNESLLKKHTDSDYREDIHLLTDVKDELLSHIYESASVLLFPSLEEGFGWPIAEAMASGCTVITTNKAPMTEVGGNAAFYINRRPLDEAMVEQWVQEASGCLARVLQLSPYEHQVTINKGLTNVERFNTKVAFDQFEVIYHSILNDQTQI